MRIWLRMICVAGVLTVGTGMTMAHLTRPTPLEGKGVSAEYRGEGHPDTFKPGAVLFTDRTYTVAECPDWLKGKRFPRGKPVRFRFTLRKGSSYAFWVGRDATGRSDGYVAGGGPGFTGMADTVGRASLEAGKRLGVLEAGLSSAAVATTAKKNRPKSARKKARTLDHAGQLAAKLEPTRVLVYKKVVGRELHLNIFEPEGWKPTDRRPCFLSIHGGGWTGLEPRRQYPFAAHFAKLGMVAICIDYRLVKPGSGTTVFDCVKDGRSAMRYVRAHAAELGIDPQKIIANGGSAGGHIAAGTALFDGVDEAGEDTTVSCIPNAMVLYFPVIDTSEAGYGNAKIGSRWRELCPLHHVRPDLPPTVVFHGTGDTVTPFAGAKAFCDAMLKAGNRCELITTKDAAHGYLMRDRKLYEQALRQTEAFLASRGLMPKK